MMKGGFAGVHCKARLGPDFGFDAAAADCTRNFPIRKKEHLCAALLWRRAARVGHGRNDNALAPCARFVDQATEIALCNGAHESVVSDQLRARRCYIPGLGMCNDSTKRPLISLPSWSSIISNNSNLSGFQGGFDHQIGFLAGQD